MILKVVLEKIGCEVVDMFSVDSEKGLMSNVCENCNEFSRSL